MTRFSKTRFSKTRFSMTCWWSADHVPAARHFDVYAEPDPKPSAVVARSAAAKRIVAEHLAEQSPEALELLKAFGSEFGPLAEVVVEDDQALRDKLEDALR
jgi:hypothetical protein